jgi:beta-xylosidase
VISDAVMVYDGHEKDPTIEGPKFYKRNGYYYIFAPGGGVSTGWQTVLRSKNIYGPYERKVVMDQGTTSINGPHQGAWVDTKTGEDWFLHFQDKDAYGRVVHLQPMKWINDWPVIGEDKDGDGKGQPIMVYKKPTIGKIFSITTVADSDEFNSPTLGLQWQWQANPKEGWAFPTSTGSLRLFSVYQTDSTINLWNTPNILGQKTPADEFTATTKLSFQPRLDGERAGLIVLGADYAFVSLVKKQNGNYISFGICKNADKEKKEIVKDGEKVSSNDIYLRVQVTNGGVCAFSYSEDGKNFKSIGEKLTAKPGRWVGAKLGLFCTRTIKTNDAGFADVDWFRISQ